MVHRLMERAEQPPKPPYHLVDGQACGGVADHHLDLPQRLASPATSPVSRSTSAIACQLRRHTERAVVHPPSCGMTLIEEIKRFGEAG
jgi:hypothetical protein